MIGLKDQCFGVEIEMTGITRGQAARALADYFGTEARYTGGTYGTWTVKDPRRKTWELVNGSSILAEQKIGSDYEIIPDDDSSAVKITSGLGGTKQPIKLKYISTFCRLSPVDLSASWTMTFSINSLGMGRSVRQGTQMSKIFCRA